MTKDRNDAAWAWVQVDRLTEYHGVVGTVLTGEVSVPIVAPFELLREPTNSNVKDNTNPIPEVVGGVSIIARGAMFGGTDSEMGDKDRNKVKQAKSKSSRNNSSGVHDPNYPTIVGCEGP